MPFYATETSFSFHKGEFDDPYARLDADNNHRVRRMAPGNSAELVPFRV
jgi:hypothetical protein